LGTGSGPERSEPAQAEAESGTLLLMVCFAEDSLRPCHDALALQPGAAGPGAALANRGLTVTAAVARPIFARGRGIVGVALRVRARRMLLGMPEEANGPCRWRRKRSAAHRQVLRWTELGEQFLVDCKRDSAPGIGKTAGILDK